MGFKTAPVGFKAALVVSEELLWASKTVPVAFKTLAGFKAAFVEF